jgi:putative membrane protein
MYHDGFYVHHSGPGFFAWFFMILFLLLLVGLVVALVARYAGPRPYRLATGGSPSPYRDDPLETLRMRYARGEIERDAFLQASADLGGPAPPADTS